jgi:hypothetical protein
MTDRFDLESQIMSCWQVTTDLSDVAEAILDGPEMTQDDIANALIGMQKLYDIKFNKLYQQFEQLVQDGKIK